MKKSKKKNTSQCLLQNLCGNPSPFVHCECRPPSSVGVGFTRSRVLSGVSDLFFCHHRDKTAVILCEASTYSHALLGRGVAQNPFSGETYLITRVSVWWDRGWYRCPTFCKRLPTQVICVSFFRCLSYSVFEQAR